MITIIRAFCSEISFIYLFFINFGNSILDSLQMIDPIFTYCVSMRNFMVIEEQLLIEQKYIYLNNFDTRIKLSLKLNYSMFIKIEPIYNH
jgi:hypothetical protein